MEADTGHMGRESRVPWRQQYDLKEAAQASLGSMNSWGKGTFGEGQSGASRAWGQRKGPTCLVPKAALSAGWVETMVNWMMNSPSYKQLLNSSPKLPYVGL